MKVFLLFACLPIACSAIAQCAYPVAIRSKDGHCTGATLRVNTSHALSEIVWYDDGDPTPVKEAFAADSLNIARMILPPDAGTPAGPGSPSSFLRSVFADAAGNFYAVYQAVNEVKMWKPGAAAGITVAGGKGAGVGADQLNSPAAVYVDISGNIFVADYNNNRVQRWVPGATSGVTVAGGNGAGAGPGQLSGPAGLYVDCDGTVYVADAVNNRVQKWISGATTGVTVAGGNGPGINPDQLDQPQAVWLDGKGNVYVADANNARIQEWTPGSVAGVTVAGGHGAGANADQLDGPTGLFVDYTGKITIADTYNSRVQVWMPGTGSGTTLLGATELNNRGFLPPVISSVNLDPRGNVWVADEAAGVVEGFQRLLTIDTTYTAVHPGRYSIVTTDINGYPVTPESYPIFSVSTGPIDIQVSASATHIDICTPVTFTAGVTNADVASFQWQVSGVDVGGDSLVYSNNLFADGDRVRCIMTTDTGCPGVTAIDTSNAILLSVNSEDNNSVAITASGTAVCIGSPVTFSTSVSGAGSATASFQWFINGLPAGGGAGSGAVTGPSYTTDSLSDGDVVYCLLPNEAACTLSKSNSIPIEVDSIPAIPSPQVFSIPYGKSGVLTPAITGRATSYLWMPGTGLSDSTIRNPVADPRTNANYQLSVLSPGGCKASGLIAVKVFTPLEIPGAFSPNGDGRNDVFYVMGGPEGARIRDFSIFNRWGQRLFQVHDGLPGDSRFGWNGMAGEKPAPTGTYVYVVVLALPGGQQQVYKGMVILVR